MQHISILLVLFTLTVSVIQGSVGPSILYNSSQTGPALFSWNRSDVNTSVLVVVTSPAEEEVFQFNGKDTRRHDVSSRYKDRVNITNLTFDIVQFSLTDVTRKDAGNYTCREGDHKIGRFIPNCGQILYYLDENSVPLMPKKTISKHIKKVCPAVKIALQSDDEELELREGQTLTLTCVVEAASPPVPSHGFSWTFQPLASSPASPPQQLGETGDTLTRGPLTREHSGQYTCRARNDQSLDEELPPGEHSINLIVIESCEECSVPETPYHDAAVGLGVTVGLFCLVGLLILFFCARSNQMLCFNLIPLLSLLLSAGGEYQ